jgi:S1-C subfamily serine protease
VQFCPADIKKKCKSETLFFTGSGFVIDRIKLGSFIITAAHLCKAVEVTKDLKELQTKITSADPGFKVVTFGGKQYDAKVLKYNNKIDICMMFVEGLTNIEPVEIARKIPKVGEKIYNIAAPQGVFAPGMVSILEGRFSGDHPTKKRALYSLPAAGGSSGSMILNHKGRLIGVLHSVWRYFHHITIGTNFKDTKDFIKKNLQYYKTYNKDMEILELSNIFKVKKIKKKSKPKISTSPK